MREYLDDIKTWPENEKAEIKEMLLVAYSMTRQAMNHDHFNVMAEGQRTELSEAYMEFYQEL